MTDPVCQPHHSNRQPVFLLGIRHRSGTNMLQDVLTMHPQCAAHFDPEDFLVSGLGSLESYTESVHRRRRSRQFRTDIRSNLRQALGTAIATYVVNYPEEIQTDTRYVVAKTPSVEGLQAFRRFFPDAPVILLVRDGRAIVESSMRSFGADFEDGCRRYAFAARTLNAFLQNDSNPERTILVRFEDYLADKRATIEKILDFLELDKSDFPFADLEDLPVRGSSELKTQGSESIHWSPVAADASFDPRDRFENWTPARHARFNWIAGAQLESLGYRSMQSSSWLTDCTNVLRDLMYLISPVRLFAKIRRRVLRTGRG